MFGTKLTSRLSRACALLWLGFACGASARAQCPGWTAGFADADFNDNVHALKVFDDGSGPQLYAGGRFTRAGGFHVRGVARWNGSTWADVGGGTTTNGRVEDFAVYDDGLGGGPKLYATGEFTTMGGVPAAYIARWEGTSWTPLGAGLNATGRCLLVFDDGTGPKLVVGGDFSQAGGLQVGGIASWDGVSWHAFGAGTDLGVHALAAFDDGSGSGTQLYAGGQFNHAEGVLVNGLAKWTGTAWVGFGGGLAANHSVESMIVHDDGSGPALYIGGQFQTAGGLIGQTWWLGGIGRWNGQTWSQVGGVITDSLGTVYTLAVHDFGSGPNLYAAGAYTNIGGISVANIARWDGSAWFPVGFGFQGFVRDMLTWDDGSGGGAQLYAGGDWTTSGIVSARHVARFDGGSWSAVTPPGAPLNSNTNSMSVYDDGTGPSLYAVGSFTASVIPGPNRIARWDGSHWVPLPGFGLSAVAFTSVVFDDGTGSALYVGGSFVSAGGNTVNRIARWNGTSWSSVGGGANANVFALAVHDDGSGPALYASGQFTSIGGVAANYIARWDGTSWSALGAGLDDAAGALVSAADGSGRALYAGGFFTWAGAGAAAHIAKWDGTSWSPVGGGTDASVYALAEYDDGQGTALFAGGLFTHAGGVPSSRFARWDGTAWSAPPGGSPSDRVYVLTVHDDGNGPGLYAGGAFNFVGGMPVAHIARYDAGGWSPLASGLSGTGGSPPQSTAPYAMASFSDGPGQPASLFVGGFFDMSGSVPASNIARWRGCPRTHVNFCFGDGSGTACPCANLSASVDQAGCLNSFGTGGRLRGAGVSSVHNDTLVLSGSDMPSSSALYFQGTTRIAGGQGSLFGDGLRCAGGSVLRLATKINASGASQFPEPSDPRVSTAGAVQAASTRTYQVWYRNSAGFCTSDVFNLTNGVEVVWTN